MKSSTEFCASTSLHSWYAPRLEVNQLSFSKANLCFAGLLSPSLQMWEILLHLLKRTHLGPAEHRGQTPPHCGHGSHTRIRAQPHAKAPAFLNVHFGMYTASEKLASLRYFLKDMCETKYVKHKCVNPSKALWTSTNSDNV